MNVTSPARHSEFSPGNASAPKLLWTAALLLTGSFALAQKPPAPAPPPPSPTPLQYTVPSQFDQEKKVFDSNGKPISPQSAKESSCFLPPLNAWRPATAAVADMQVSAKSQREFDDGCAALRKKNVADAETHLRKAVKQDPKYSAAWVLLGQVLEAQQKTADARDACTQPVTAGIKYVPAYLCLADISAHSKQWDDVLALSGHALELDPANDAVAYSYNALANFNLHHLPEAEKSALKAAEIDKSNADPRVHFLLAQIYEAKGDRPGEVAQLREYLKFATDPNDQAMVKQYLSELDGQTGK
jgi:tetratricopeptide (TPR) repeat protein